MLLFYHLSQDNELIFFKNSERPSEILGTLRSDNSDVHENVAEKIDFSLFHFFCDFPRGPVDWREFGLELKRRDCARVLTEMVEFIALPFPFLSKLRPRPHVSVFV